MRRGKSILTVLIILNIAVWIIWAIGYPVYCIINNIGVFKGGIYAIVASMLAVILNILNLIYQVLKKDE